MLSFKMVSHGLNSLQQYLQLFVLSLTSKGLILEQSKIAEPTVFQVVLWGWKIKSFQSAITAPRVNLNDYGNATAQS